MDGSKENQHVFSVKSTERIGLRQILDPGTAKFRGYNVFHVVIAVIVVSILGVSSLCPFGFYHLSNDVDAFVFYLGTIQNFSFCVYKIVNIVYYSKDLWKCLNDTNFASMAYRRYDETAIIFESWRKRTWRVSFLYDAIVFISLASWIFVMFALSNTLITIRNPDGSYSQFRLNIGNVYFMVSDETYNRHFYKFFVVELTLYASYYYFSLLFDICLTIMCFSLSFQLDVIRSAIQSLGHETRSSRDNRLENTLEHDELCDVYEDLKTVLADHQNVMKNIGSFYNVIRPVTLIQILIASNTQILIWFLASLSFSKGEVGNSMVAMKVFILQPVFGFQLFMTCFLLDTMNEKQDSIILALYSSNWAEMNMKSKKLILLAISMNKANCFKLKYTRTKLVNLELFTSTMRVCYSIFSMLVNYTHSKDKNN